MKRCPIKNCHTAIPQDLTMCGVHWRMVPTAMRVEWLKSRPSSPVEKERMNYRAIAHVRNRISPELFGEALRPAMENNFKFGDAVLVELITHDRGKSTKYSTWKPAVFHSFDSKRVWVTVKTPAGEAKRSFPAGKVRRANG